jgi:thymidylate synthase (FAD)
MRLIKPSAVIEFIEPRDQILKRIEASGRTCYKSEGKATDGSAPKFCHSICQVKKHESVIEHASATVRFICDRGVSHELVRHRLSSFSQESTRYVDYSGDKSGGHCQFIIPLWLDLPEGEFFYGVVVKNKTGEGIAVLIRADGVTVAEFETSSKEASWLRAMAAAEVEYHHQVKTLKQSPQEARAVLPNSTKTEVVVSSNLRQWRNVFKLRVASNAHPQMREVMIPLFEQFKAHLPEFYADIEVK